MIRQRQAAQTAPAAGLFAVACEPDGTCTIVRKPLAAGLFGARR